MKLVMMWRDRRYRWSLIFIIWTLFGLFLASQMYMDYSRSDRPFKWQKILLLEMSYGYIWALLTPLMLWLARKFRIERNHWQESLTIHIFASLFIGFTTRLAHDLMFYFFVYDGARPITLVRVLQNVYLIFDYGMLIYWVILLINYSFDYYRRYQEGEVKASRLETQLAQAELQALKMQLQPHFLFNTLHSISALLHKDVNAADTMIARLGDFLRLTLENAGTQEVSLQEEIEFLRCYLEIERMRFRDRLTVQINIEPDALAARVPNLILQPIVENAIRHGIAPRSKPGRIEISARRQDGLLQVQVTDDGPGLPTNGHSKGILKEGVGLANTQARLQQIYGKTHRLDLSNAPLGGLTVTLEIPFKEEFAERRAQTTRPIATHV
ncbi:MAG TPA: histidine kinase [Blastocatellia bacterium]|nr:histidine kinase [Blastocatellia bacterium]